jgi:hypothetical protein
MPRRAGSPLVLHDPHDPVQGSLGWQLAMDHRGQFAVRLAYTDLDTTDRDARHFETTQFPSQVVVLVDDVESGVDQESSEF